MIASGSGDRTVCIWDLTRGVLIQQVSLDDGVTSVAISPDSQRVAAGCLNKRIYMLRIPQGNVLYHSGEYEGNHSDSVYSVTFARDGRALFTASLDKTIKPWDLRDLEDGSQDMRCARTFSGHGVRENDS